MTAQFNYGGSDLGNQVARLGALSGFASSAEKGTIATSGSLPVDDPGGARNLVGLKVVQVKELACATPTLWYGYASDRNIARGAGDSLRTGADRRWDPQLVDVNAVFGFEVLHGSWANRPAETDLQRIAALLASAFLPQVFDLGLVASTGGVAMSAADYRGQTPANLMDDCANISNRNYFAYWDDTNAKIGLFYQLPRYSGYQSTLRLTNVLADVDDTTTFEATAALNRNPQDVYSSVLVTYSGGQYFDTRASTASAFFERQTAVSQPNIKTLTHAKAFAERFLDDHATETDRLTVTVRLPIAKVNLLLAGMDVPVRFSHLPSWGQGGSSYTYVRAAQRTAAQDEQSDQFYNVTLELQDGRATGGMGTALGNPDNTRVWPVNQEPFVQDCIGGVVTNLAPVYMDSHPYHVTASSPGDPTKLGTSYLATTVGGAHLQDDTNSFITDTSAGDGTGWTQGDNGHYTVTTLPLGIPIHLYITYSALAGSMYTDGATVFGLQSIPPNATGVSIASFAVGASSCGVGGTLDCGYFILSKAGVVSPTASECNAPSVGQLIAEETAPPTSGATVFTTGYPYAPGSLHVFVGGVEWIATETSPSAGTFTLATNPSPLLVTWTYVAANSVATGATVTSPPPTNPKYATSGTSTTLPWSYAKANGGLAGDGTTDDTAAFQAWITSVTASGTQSGWFFFEPGTYLIGGALQDTGARNAQILLPNVDTTIGHQITLTFQGAARPPLSDTGITVDNTAGYAVLKSTLTGASGTAAVFSGGQYPAATNVQVNVRDLICVLPDNSSLTFWNLDSCWGGGFDSVYVESAGTFARSTIAQPTNSNAYAVKLPHYGYSNYTYVNGLIVVGVYTGLRTTDLATVIGYGQSWCIVGLEIPTHQHSSLVVSFHSSATTYPIRVTGLAYVDILQTSIEHDNSGFPSWTHTVYDLDDGSNDLHGHIRWFGWSLDTGLADHSFVVNGGTNSLHEEIGSPPAGTGTVTSVALTVPAELSVSGSPITTTGTLAVTKANESANTVWAGPTSGSAAAPTFRALVAADIPAGVGAVHELIIQTGTSSPPVPIWNSDGTDFVYSS